MKELEVRALNGAPAEDGKVELRDVHVDLNELTILAGLYNRNYDKKVIFTDVCGFRALDEGDLSFWWQHLNLSNGWCFQVIKGGWHDFERERKDFLSGQTDLYREYLVIGVDLCVSVLTQTEPEFHETTSS